MKTNILSIFCFILLSSAVTASIAQDKNAKATIKVYGNCGMCEARIEAALDKAGIKHASWDVRTKNLEVVYNAKKISEQQIHELIAAVGHDTDKVKAKNEVYAELPYCCLYRDHDHSGIQDGPEKMH